MKHSPQVMIISGFDATASAGILLDSHIATLHGCSSYCVLPSLMVQNHSIAKPVDFNISFLQEQLLALQNPPRFAKIGLLYNIQAIEIVAKFITKHNIVAVADIPLVASSGSILVDDIQQYTKIFFQKVLPHLILFTPNLEELKYFKNEKEILQTGCKAVLVKGGHSYGENSTDTLYTHSKFRDFTLPRLNFTENIRGTGCGLSTAITCNLANGDSLENAIFNAKKFIFDGIRNSVKIDDKTRTMNFIKK